MLIKQLKYLSIGAFYALVCFLIIYNFGWIGLLAALPIFFLIPFVAGYLKGKRGRRNSLR